MNTDHNLNRFISAQEFIYAQVLTELRNGNKSTHWMWFIFPQIEGLGNSPTAKLYSIKSIDEAKEYLSHPVLGSRLLECSGILLDIKYKTANDIFGYPDNLKLRSCMTLFSQVTAEQKIFNDVLEKYFNGQPDHRTLSILKEMKG